MPRTYYDDFPVCATVRDLILDGFRRGGDKRQFLFRDASGEEREKTFADVRRDTEALGAYLRTLGVKKGDRIAILSENSYFWNVAYYAGIINGSVVVPLESGMPAEDVFDQIRNSGCVAVFYSDAQAEKIGYAKAQPGSGLLHCLPAAKAEAFYAAGNAAPPELKTAFLEETAAPEDLACIVYTSGTTGKTKGVMLTHKNICANVY